MLAQAFWHRVTEGQPFDVQNDSRREFLREVIDAANKFAGGGSRTTDKKGTPGKPKAHMVSARSSLGSLTPPRHLGGNYIPERPPPSFPSARRILSVISPRVKAGRYSQNCVVLRQLDRFFFKFPLFLRQTRSFVFDQEARSDPSSKVVVTPDHH